MSIPTSDKWLRNAWEVANAWPTATVRAVLRANPYEGTGVRPGDWVVLVAHVSYQKAEDPIATAERLALYVTTYREAHAALLMPTIVKENQTHDQ